MDESLKAEVPGLSDRDRKWRRRRKVIRHINLSFMGLIVLVAAWALIEPRILLTTRVTIKDDDVPVGLDGFRIVHLADIHHGPYLSIERVRKLVDRINRMEPDLILITGDYVHLNEKYIEPCFQELKRLKARYGILSVLGNHDYWESAAMVRKGMREAGIEDLENRAKWIEARGVRFKVGGVGDLWEARQDLGPTISDISEEDFVILLEHNPDYIDQIPTRLIDLMLCGHTHGGQVTFFGLYAPMLPIRGGQEYRSGVVQKGPMKVIISRGIGAITPPVRFFCPPQIILITLEHLENSAN